MTLLTVLDQLHLPTDHFAIFGSGPLAVRKIRASADLDIIVTGSLWKKLSLDYFPYLRGVGNTSFLLFEGVEIYHDWLTLTDKVEEMIASADFIAGYPYVQLKYVIEWKKDLARGKDLKDLELIEEYLLQGGL